MIAILPAAGRGTRMGEVSQGRSKEMLPVGMIPVIQWAIDEAWESGADTVAVVSSPDKDDLNQYLATQDVIVAMQFRPTGLGTAVAQAAQGSEALIVLPDTLYYPESPSKRIVRALTEGYEVVIPTEIVDDEQVRSYGIVEVDEGGRIARILEKPNPDATPSRMAVAGRFGIGAAAMNLLVEDMMVQESQLPEGAEVSLTAFLNRMLSEDFEGLALPTHEGEVRYDCGSPEGYLRAVEAIR